MGYTKKPSPEGEGAKGIVGTVWVSQIPTDPVPPAYARGTTVCGMGTGQHSRRCAPTKNRGCGRVRVRTLTTLQEKGLDRLVWPRSARCRVSTDHLSTHCSGGGLSGLLRAPWISHLGAGFALRCGQRFSDPNIASQRCVWQHNWAHQRFVHSGPLVLGVAPRKYPPLTTERDRTVSRRSEPSSRTALIGEQPNPWDRLQPQDAMSRHRGAKPSRRYGLLGKISLLSPG